MDNSGFRAFAIERGEKDSSKDGATPAPLSEEDRARKKAKQQAQYDRRMAIQKRREEALAVDSKYTDRAAERRKEENKEVRNSGTERKHWMEEEEEEAERAEAESARVADGPTFAQLGEREDLSSQQHRVSIAQSKYLGGDIEHTHLVKGLDFALLQKVRSDNVAADATHAKKTKEDEAKRASRRQQLEASAASAASKKSAGATGKASSSAAASSSASGANAAGSSAPRFVTDMGREVHRILFERDSRPSKALTEGRIVLTFDVSPDSTAELPNSTIRADDDLSGPVRSREKLIDAGVPDGLIEKLGRVAKYVAGAGGERPRPSKSGKSKKGSGDYPFGSDPSDVIKLIPLPARSTDAGSSSGGGWTETSSSGVMRDAVDKKSRWGEKKPAAEPETAGAASSKPPPQPKAPAVVEEDVDDIFGDVGSDYKCEPSAAQLVRARADRADAAVLRTAKPEEEEEAAAPPLAWDEEEAGGGGGAAANAMVKSLLARAKAGKAGDGGGKERQVVMEDDDDMDDEELLKASRGKKAGAAVPKSVGKDVAMGGTGAEEEAYGELLPDSYEGYNNSLQIGGDDDDENLIVRSKDKEAEEAGDGEESKGGKGGKGKGGKGKRPAVDVDALKREAKMDRELVAIEKLMEERKQKRQKRDEGLPETEE